MLTKEFIEQNFAKLNDPNFDVDTRDKAGRTLLFLASKICDFEKIKQLVCLGCNMLIVDNIGYNCLHTVCTTSEKHENKLNIVKYLINEHKLDPYCCTNKEESCLFLAVKAGNTEVVEYLLEHYSDLLDIKPFSDSSCLEIAIVYNHYDIFNLLLSKGADVDDMNSESCMTCLMTASYHHRVEMVEALINRGAEVNLINYKYKNALYYATQKINNAEQTILLLLENGSFVCERTRKLLNNTNNKKILELINECY